jgi:hypothetical protein
MQTEPALALVARHPEPPGLEIRVNFGVFAGRPATAAELDDLAKVLLAKVREVSIVAEERHEVAPESEVALHQVRIDVATDELPEDGHEVDVLAGRLLEAAETWARACMAERHADISEL